MSILVPVVACMVVPPGAQGAEEQSGQDRAQRPGPAEQGHRHGVEANGPGDRNGQVVLGAEHGAGGGQAAQRPGDDHDQGGDARDADPGGAGGLRVGAGGPELEAEFAALHEPPHAQGRDEGHDEAQVEAEGAAQQERVLGAGADRQGLGVGAVPDEGAGGQRVGQEIGGDGVEHNGRNDLAGPRGRLEDADDAAPQGPAGGGAGHGGQDVQPRRQVPGEADVAAGHGPQDDLPLPADVEQSGAEGHRHAQARQDEGGGDGEGLGGRSPHAGRRRGLPVEDAAAHEGGVGPGQQGAGGAEEVGGPGQEVA